MNSNDSLHASTSNMLKTFPSLAIESDPQFHFENRAEKIVDYFSTFMSFFS